MDAEWVLIEPHMLPQPGKRHQPPARQRHSIGLLPRRTLLPLVEVIDRDQATVPLKRLAEGGFAFDSFGLGVDVGKADFEVLRPEC
jgi:hypothetical protein